MLIPLAAVRLSWPALVIVTPEIVEPIEAGQKLPNLTMPLAVPPASEGIRQPPASHSQMQPVPPAIPIEVLRPPAAAEPAAPSTGAGFKPAPTVTMPPASLAPSSDLKP